MAASDFCDCEPADLLAEGFVETGVDHPDIQARIAGQCITCGASGVTDWLTVGRVVAPDSGEFYPVVYESVHLPGDRGRSPRLEE